MANKWMIAAVTAALFSGADWFGATHRIDTTQAAAPAISVPAVAPQPLAATREDNAMKDEASREAHS